MEIEIAGILAKISRLEPKLPENFRSTFGGKIKIRRFLKDLYTRAEFFIYDALVFRRTLMFAIRDPYYFRKFDEEFIANVMVKLEYAYGIQKRDAADMLNSRFDIYENICMEYMSSATDTLSEMSEALYTLLSCYYVRRTRDYSMSLSDYHNLPVFILDMLEMMDIKSIVSARFGAVTRIVSDSLKQQGY